jgi:hypothetical protein
MVEVDETVWLFGALPQATEIHVATHLVHAHASHRDVVRVGSL